MKAEISEILNIETAKISPKIGLSEIVNFCLYDTDYVSSGEALFVNPISHLKSSCLTNILESARLSNGECFVVNKLKIWSYGKEVQTTLFLGTTDCFSISFIDFISLDLLEITIDRNRNFCLRIQHEYNAPIKMKCCLIGQLARVV